MRKALFCLLSLNKRSLFSISSTPTRPAMDHIKRKLPSSPPLVGGPQGPLLKTRKLAYNSIDRIPESNNGTADPELSHSPIQSTMPSIRRFSADTEVVEWQQTIEDVVQSVVAIQFSQVATFDCDSAVVSEATGFVVDSKRGIILTNRHVVGAGPFWGYAVFDNHEECPVRPIYRDPVHDFGLLQFDTSKIKYMKVRALPLRPDLAKVGCEIRVVGNDAGQKLSILSGFISRLDRNAPDYGGLTYNDFNTEYIQAAASASGGSSGSPVVDIHGNAIALQAGGSSESSTDFFLPLYRGKRALECVQQCKPITRGTIQVQWYLRPFDECKRLGLTPDAEHLARQKFPGAIGLLVAETVLPEGPSVSKIVEGDCLLAIDGEDIGSFIRVDEILDESVGKDITLLIQRGGKNIEVSCTVGDLHAITPDRYLEVCGASFNDMSYQMARLYAIAVKGVFINSSSGSFHLDGSDTTGWILDSIDDKPTPNLDVLIKVMQQIPDSQKVTICYRHITDLHTNHVSIAYIDRHFYTSFRLAKRNDKTGLWDFTDLGKPKPMIPLEPQSAKFVDLAIDEPECARLSRSFVQVACFIPMKFDGYPKSRKKGYGVVLDAERGYVIVSRNIVPHDLCDVHVTVAESIVVPGRVIFMHPSQNYTIISYDPSLVLALVETPKFSITPLKRGNKVQFIGYNYNLRVVSSETKVSDISTVTIPVNPTSPRYRGTNVDSVSVDTNLASQCGSGVLADRDGTIRALWLSYMGERTNEYRDVEYKMGIDITALQNVIKNIQINGKVPENMRYLETEFYAIQIVQARIRGVSEEWIKKILQVSGDRVQLLSVYKTAFGPCNVLTEGDIILALNDKIVTKVSDLGGQYDNEELEFTIVRQKKQMKIKVPTVPIEGIETDHIVVWCGAVLQKPHQAVRQQMKKLNSGVYVSHISDGSPAYQYSISTTNFITHINEVPTPNLDAFLKEVRSIPENTYVKLRVVSFDNVPFACSLKTNYHYFPTAELIKNKVTNKWESNDFKN